MEEILHIIKNSNYTNDPYPHLIINDFFPKELLLSINKEWDNEDFKNRFDNSCIETHDKKIIISGSGRFRNLISISQPFKQIHDIFSNVDFFKMFSNIFKDDLKKYINPNIDVLNLKPDFKFFICMCKPNYQCNPHIDYRKCIFSILIYPDDFDDNDSRLNIYELKDKNVDIADIYPDEDNDLILRNSIKSCNNKAIATFNIPQSYHSVKPYKCNDSNKLRHYIYVSYNMPADISDKDFWLKDAKIFSKERKHKYMFDSKKNITI